MSKICLIFHLPYSSSKLASYYDQFTKSLNKYHDLLVVNLTNASKNNEFCNNKIEEFKPDLIITYNNVINEYIIQNTDCFILVVESDLYPNGFHNIHLMSKYRDRIFIALANNNLKNRIKALINFIKDERFVVLKNSTSFLDFEEKNLVDQDIEISFIGTIIGIKTNNVVDFLAKNLNNKANLNYAKSIINKAIFNIHCITDIELEFLGASFHDLFHYISYLNRVKHLELISDLGLKIFGKSTSLNNIALLGNLIFSIEEIEGILSASENKDIYDRSKLSINLHFAHNSIDPNLSSYSWRVPDIMASNSCLVSTYCPAIDQDFGKWVKIPQFSNKYEAYEICKKLLSDEPWRIDIVENSKIAIREGGFTFEERVEELERIFNLKRNEEGILKYEFILSKKTNEESQENKNIPIKSKLLISGFLKSIIKIIKKICIIIYRINIERIFNLPMKLYRFFSKKMR